MSPLFAIVFGVVALILIGVGIVLGLVGLALVTFLVGIGVVSSSVFIGVRSGRAASGIRAFLIQTGLLIGIPAGAVCAWLGKSLFEAYGSGWTVLAYGALGGAFAGLLVALILDYVSRRTGTWISGRLQTFGDSRLATANEHYRTGSVRDVSEAK
jgi:hypothetical protein